MGISQPNESNVFLCIIEVLSVSARGALGVYPGGILSTTITLSGCPSLSRLIVWCSVFPVSVSMSPIVWSSGVLLACCRRRTLGSEWRLVTVIDLCAVFGASIRVPGWFVLCGVVIACCWPYCESAFAMRLSFVSVKSGSG